MRSFVICCIMLCIFIVEINGMFPGRAGTIAVAVRNSRERRQRRQRRSNTQVYPHASNSRRDDSGSGQVSSTPRLVREHRNPLKNESQHDMHQYSSSGSDVDINKLNPDQRMSISEHLQEIAEGEQSWIDQHKGKLIFFSLLIVIIILSVTTIK
eukprot:UN00398